MTLLQLLACLTILANVALFPMTKGQDCGDDYLQTSDHVQRMQDAEIVLYGRDVSPVTACAGAPETCGRLEITFEVDCVLKSGGITIRSHIFIGRGKSSLSRCDVNVFGHGNRNTMIVLVKYNKTTESFVWDAQPRQISYFLVSADQVARTARGACGLTEWTAPRGGQNHCPLNVSGSDFMECGPGCRAPWFMAGDFCYRVTRNGGLDRHEAKRTCVSDGGVLATFPSQEEWLPVKTVLGQESSMRWWIGGKASDYDNADFSDWKDSKTKLPFILADNEGWMDSDNESTPFGAICQKELSVHYALKPVDRNSQMLELQFSTPKLHLYFCCNPAYYNQQTTKLTWTNLDETVKPGYTRMQPDVVIKKADSEAYYTLIMADVSGHDKTRGSRTTPYINWMVADLKVNEDGQVNTASGQTLFVYDPPKPISRDPVPHVVFLARQPRKFDKIEDVEHEMSKFSEGQCLRCFFILRVFKEVYELKTEDALWFRSAIDGWTAYTRVVKDQTSLPSVVCPRVWDNIVLSGENAICPLSDVNASRTVISAFSTTLAILALAIFLVY